MIVQKLEKLGSQKIKCVLSKKQFVLIEGKQYSCGAEIKTLDLLVSQPNLEAVKAMLEVLGFKEWGVVEWWPVLELEPSF